jgi:hypothetical protein
MAFYHKQIHLYSCSFMCTSSNTGEGKYSPVHFNSCVREQSALRPQQSVPSTHQMGNWVNTTASVDAVKKRKILSPARN